MRNITYQQAEQILNDGLEHTEMEWRAVFRTYAYRAQGGTVNEEKAEKLKQHYDKIFYEHCNDMFKKGSVISGFDAIMLYEELKEYGYKYPIGLLKSILGKFIWMDAEKKMVLRSKIDDLRSNFDSYVAKGDVIELYEP